MSVQERELLERRQFVIAASLGYELACLEAELHPGNAHGADSVDLASDILDDALAQYTVALEAVEKLDG